MMARGLERRDTSSERNLTNGIFKGRGRRRIPGAIAPDRRNGKDLPPHHPGVCGLRTRIPDRTAPVSYTHLENELIGYNFLIGDTKKYKAFPWLAISNMDEQKLTVCEEMMKIQIAFFEKLGMQKIADHCVRIMENYRKGIGKQKESDCR